MAAEHAEECTDGANDGVVCMYVTGDYTPTEDNQVCYIIKNSNDFFVFSNTSYAFGIHTLSRFVS